MIISCAMCRTLVCVCERLSEQVSEIVTLREWLRRVSKMMLLQVCMSVRICEGCVCVHM